MIFSQQMKDTQRRPDRVNVVTIAALFQAYRDPACSRAKTKSTEAARPKKEPIKSSLCTDAFEKTPPVWYSELAP